LSGSGSTTAAFTELASPLLHAVRLSLNSVVAASAQSSNSSTTTATASKSLVPGTPAAPAVDSSAIAQFVNGGGQFNLAAAVPAYSFITTTGSFSALFLAAPRVG